MVIKNEKSDWSKVISITLPPSTVKWIDELAKKQNRTRSNMIYCLLKAGKAVGEGK